MKGNCIEAGLYERKLYRSWVVLKETVKKLDSMKGYKEAGLYERKL